MPPLGRGEVEEDVVGEQPVGQLRRLEPLDQLAHDGRQDGGLRAGVGGGIDGVDHGFLLGGRMLLTRKA